MADMLSSSLLWRALLAIGGWFSAMVHSSKVFAWLGRTWHTSRTRAWLLRRLSASDAPTRDSRSAKRFARLNARLAARHGLKDCLDDSILCRIWRFFVHCGQNSRLFSWLFSDGLHGVILFALSMYVVIDYVLRDLLAVPVLSSCWDECLMLLALGYVIYERLGRKTPLKTGCNPLDLPVCLFITACFALMNVVTPYYSVQISGFRATVQYMLWFFLITRLVHNAARNLSVYRRCSHPVQLDDTHGILRAHARLFHFRKPQYHGRFHDDVRADGCRTCLLHKKPQITGACVALCILHVLWLPVYDVARRLDGAGDCHCDLCAAG